MAFNYGGHKQVPAYINPSWYPRADDKVKEKSKKGSKPLPEVPEIKIPGKNRDKEVNQESGRRQTYHREKEKGEARGYREHHDEPPRATTPHHTAGPGVPPSSPRKVLFESDFMRHSVSVRYPLLHPTLAIDTSRIRLDVRVYPHRGSERLAAARFWNERALPGRPAVHMRLISPHFPWTFELDYRPLLAQGTTHYITCGDVWSAITEGLSQPISDSEWNQLVLSRRSDKNKRKRMIEAIVEQRSDAQGKYARRADWLGRDVVFRGLELCNEFAKDILLPGRELCPETWVMRFTELKM